MSVVTVNTRPQDNPNGFLEGPLTPAGWTPDHQVYTVMVNFSSEDNVQHTGIDLDYGDGREPAVVSTNQFGNAEYEGGYGVGFSSPDPVPGQTYTVTISGGEMDTATFEVVLPAYPEAPDSAYRQSIGRADVAACIPEDGPRGLGFKG